MSLQLVHVGLARGDRLLSHPLDLTLPPGSLVQLVGPNGAGKSTLLRVLAGLSPLAAGEVLWAGRRLADWGEAWRRQLLYIGHQDGLKDDFGAVENLLISARIGGSALCADQATRALRAAGLSSGLLQPVARLSQGQRQRVALARLFTPHVPPLVLLDEPFEALDADAIERVVNRLLELQAQGAVVLLSTHQLQPVQGPGRQVLRLTPTGVESVLPETLTGPVPAGTEWVVPAPAVWSAPPGGVR